MSKEQENFYRHCTVIVDILRLVLLQFIDHHLSLQGITFQDFVRKHQHEIYHLCVNMFPCCACSPGTTPGYKGSRVLQEQQMSLLFDKYGPKLSCHKPGSASSPKCCCPVKSGITVNILDVSLARVMLINFLVPVATQERKAIDDLINIRNASYSHATKGLMSNDEYTTSIEAITRNLLIIACVCKNETEIKQKLSEALNEPLDSSICMQLQKTLLLQIEKKNEVVQAIEKLTKVVENKISSNEELHVSLTESFVRLLSNKEVLEGHDVQLECVVVRSDMEGKWYKDGNEICDSHNMSIVKYDRKLSLYIYGTNLEDRGEYSCEVNGQVTKALLDVIAFVTRTIRNKRCYKGDTVNFLCEVVETDTLAQWYKDGMKIENKRYLIKQIGKIHELTITFADHSDNGCFTVNVNNRTRQATLAVEEYFTKTLRNTRCFEGNTVKFECVVAETGMSAVWYKDGVKIENKRYHITLLGKTHELIIENAEHSDNGCFTVNVNGRSKQATLNVQEYFTKTLRNTKCFEGNTVKFECVVAETGMSALWYKDGVKIENKRYHIKLIGKTHELIIENAEHSDNGCFTVNVNGKSKQATLNVQAFLTDIKSVTCTEGENVIFSCDLHSEVSTIRWFQRNMEIKISDKYVVQSHNRGSTLEIRNVNTGDSGEISVTVKHCTRKCTLEVRGKERSKKRKKEEELYEYVRLWKEIRNSTLPMSDLLKTELQEANEKIRKARVAITAYVGLTLVGGALFSIFTGGTSMAGALGAAAITFGAVGIPFMIETYVGKDVLRRTQEGINEPLNKLINSWHRIKLEGIDYLARDPLEKFISSCVDTESTSLLRAVDKIRELRLLLEHELKEMERIQGQHSFS